LSYFFRCSVTYQLYPNSTIQYPNSLLVYILFYALYSIFFYNLVPQTLCPILFYIVYPFPFVPHPPSVSSIHSVAHTLAFILYYLFYYQFTIIHFINSILFPFFSIPYLLSYSIQHLLHIKYPVSSILFHVSSIPYSYYLFLILITIFSQSPLSYLLPFYHMQAIFSLYLLSHICCLSYISSYIYILFSVSHIISPTLSHIFYIISHTHYLYTLSSNTHHQAVSTIPYLRSSYCLSLQSVPNITCLISYHIFLLLCLLCTIS